MFEFSGGGSLTFLQMISSLDSLFLGDYYGVHTIKEVKFSDSSTKPISFFLEQIGYDVVAPVKPLTRVDATRKIITGVAEPGSVVEVKNTSNVVLGAVTANSADGSYRINLLTALALNQTVKVTATDKSGNPSTAMIVGGNVPDITPPEIFSVEFDKSGGFVSGVAEAGVTVRVKTLTGVVLGGVVSDPVTGTFTIPLASPLINNERVKVYARDTAGNYSTSISIFAPDFTRPEIPIATLDVTRKIISGTAEVGSTVKILDLNDKVLKTVKADLTFPPKPRP